MSEHGKLASPTAACMAALCLVLFMFFLLLTGKVTGLAALAVGYYTLGTGIVQLVGAIVDFAAGETLSANLLLTFSVLFLVFGGVNLMVQYNSAIYKFPLDPTIGGWIVLGLVIILVFWTPAFFKGNYFFSAALIAIDLMLLSYSLAVIGVLPPSFIPIAGWFSLIGSILALYVSFGFMTNVAYGREVIPMPMPKPKG